MAMILCHRRPTGRRSAAARRRRPLERPARRFHRDPSCQRSFGAAGYVHSDEVGPGVEVVFAGLIHHPHVPFLSRGVVWQVLVELSQLEVLASLVVDAKQKALLPPCRRHQSRNRLIFIFTLPTPWDSYQCSSARRTRPVLRRTAATPLRS